MVSEEELPKLKETHVTIAGLGHDWTLSCECGHEDTACGMMNAQGMAVTHRRLHVEELENGSS